MNSCVDRSCQRLPVASIPPSQIASVSAVVAVEATCRWDYYYADADSVVNFRARFTSARPASCAYPSEKIADPVADIGCTTGFAMARTR